MTFDDARPVVQRVRAILVTPAGKLLAIRRIKPGREVYWVLPGGGIEPGDASLEDAVLREIAEETGGQAALHRLVHIATVAEHSHAIFLGRIDRWDPDARTGPELSDPDNGSYDLEELDLHPDVLGDGRIWPGHTGRWLADLLRGGEDPFALPDLRDTAPLRGGTRGREQRSSSSSAAG